MAKLAGVPENVLNRAKELVVELSDADISQKGKGYCTVIQRKWRR